MTNRSEFIALWSRALVGERIGMIDPLLTGVEAREVCSLPAMGGKCVLDRLHRPAFGQFRGSRAFGQFYVSRAFGRAVIGPCSQPLALLDRRFCNVSFRLRF